MALKYRLFVLDGEHIVALNLTDALADFARMHDGAQPLIIEEV